MYIVYEEVTPQVGQVLEVMFIRSTLETDTRTGRDIGEKDMIYPSDIPGMSSRLMINLESDELYYDYYATETVETRISGLQQENADLNLTIGNLILESANDKATIASLEETVGTLLMEVAALKGGAE